MNVAQVIPERTKLTLASVKKGPIRCAIRVLTYGVEGVGKSTFAAGAPNPIFLGLESGTMALDVARLPDPRTWAEALESVALLEKEKHDYKTLVIDPVSWLEPLCWSHLCSVNGWKSIEEPGFGKGYTAALDEWRGFVSQLERLWRLDMNIVLVGHANVRTFQNPEGPAYDRYELAMHQKTAGLLKQWSDYVLFTRHEAFVKQDQATKKYKGISDGKRVVHTQWNAAYDAKTRGKLPPEIPLSWADFVEAIAAEGKRGDELAKRVEELVAQIDDKSIGEKAKKYLTEHRADTDRIAELVNRLEIKASEKEQTK
jgi:hypothetical protein